MRSVMGSWMRSPKAKASRTEPVGDVQASPTGEGEGRWVGPLEHALVDAIVRGPVENRRVDTVVDEIHADDAGERRRARSRDELLHVGGGRLVEDDDALVLRIQHEQLAYADVTRGDHQAVVVARSQIAIIGRCIGRERGLARRRSTAARCHW